MDIQPIRSEQTLAIRQQVLWPQLSCDACKLDDDERGCHWGVYIEQQLVSVASVFIDGDSARLRKFATLATYQRQGIGSALLGHIMMALRQQSIDYFWCDARASACEFYQRFGLTVQSEPFYKSTIPYFKMGITLQLS
ncbi:GNAT family N-acetyltransferase [Celerinatantimonas yamalensis]|uniref:GNAT family N-acetyltransferase n=1 Tax=Celerinatantimonas yamalensis TaxID=559956 RepID=A0ABW9G5F1_9GAMM